MDKTKRLEELNRKIQRIEAGFIAHNNVPGHPDLCSEAVIVVRMWDCMMGSDESALNVQVQGPMQLDPKRVLKGLRRAVKWQEYDVMLRERTELTALTEHTEAPLS